MPIQFRCDNCDQLLSISSRRAGQTTVCPSCLEEIRIPGTPPAEQATAPHSMVDRPEKEFSAPPSSPVPGETSPPALVAVDPAAASPDLPASPYRRLVDSDDEDEDDWDPAHKQHTEKDAIDMTAMVDVTFLLLIFFMVTASFAAQKVLETSRPQEEQEEEGSGGGAVSSASLDDLSESSVVIDIDDHDRITIEGAPVDGTFALREVLTRKLLTEQKTEVLIQAHYNALHGTVVSVTDTAMDVGMQRVRRASRRDGP